MKVKNTLFITVLIAYMVSTLFAQDNKSVLKKNDSNNSKIEAANFVKDFLPIWDSQERITIELAEAMPSSYYKFKPTPEMKTFAEQMGHIAHTIDWMYEHVVLQKKSGKTKSLDVTKMSKKEIITYLKQAFERGRRNIKSLSKSELEEFVPFFTTGGKLKKKFGVLSVFDHITNHRAKANLYMRLCGLVPPGYGYLRLAKEK